MFCGACSAQGWAVTVPLSERTASCALSAVACGSASSHTCEVTGVALAYAYECFVWRLPRAHCRQWIEILHPVTGATFLQR